MTNTPLSNLKLPTDIEPWLDSLNIKLIWSEVSAFLDNANEQFT
jgi:hypothetical protein